MLKTALEAITGVLAIIRTWMGWKEKQTTERAAVSAAEGQKAKEILDEIVKDKIREAANHPDRADFLKRLRESGKL